jgi:hypothetical protein
MGLPGVASAASRYVEHAGRLPMLPISRQMLTADSTPRRMGTVLGSPGDPITVTAALQKVDASLCGM